MPGWVTPVMSHRCVAPWLFARRYGLNGSHVHSHKEIGRSLGVGEERSRQLERESLQRLRSISKTLTRAA
jgi:DNA-directed RNA polymerase sigma subunit (sigma70/sigma32)